MGSSAAISGAIVEALYDMAEVALDAKLRFDHTQLAEKLVHGSASGIDALTTASTNGWYFIKGKDPEAIVITLPAYLVVAHSGIKGSTKEAVGKVAKLFTQNLAQGHLESIGLMSLLMKEAIEKKEIDDVARLMNQTQFHLQELGVSHPTLDAMVKDAIELGALGAKLTGGGLGGSMIALVDDHQLAQRIINQFQQHHTKEVWLMDLRS
jgi:mevalonate kinase